MVSSVPAAGVATRWLVKPVHLLATEDGRATQQPAGSQAGFCNSLHSPQLWVGQPGMDAFCRHLTAGCTTSWAHKVSAAHEACQRWAWLRLQTQLVYVRLGSAACMVCGACC